MRGLRRELNRPSADDLSRAGMRPRFALLSAAAVPAASVPLRSAIIYSPSVLQFGTQLVALSRCWSRLQTTSHPACRCPADCRAGQTGGCADRASSFNGPTCLATLSGEKSSIDSNLRSTFNWPAFGSSLSLFCDGVRQVRVHAFQHRVEVVGIDLDELAVLQGGKRLLRLTCQDLPERP